MFKDNITKLMHLVDDTDTDMFDSYMSFLSFRSDIRLFQGLEFLVEHKHDFPIAVAIPKASWDKIREIVDELFGEYAYERCFAFRGQGVRDLGPEGILNKNPDINDKDLFFMRLRIQLWEYQRGPLDPCPY